jgi:hypothetical protein
MFRRGLSCPPAAWAAVVILVLGSSVSAAGNFTLYKFDNSEGRGTHGRFIGIYERVGDVSLESLAKLNDASFRALWVHADAVCSDGSAAGYYFRAGSGTGKDIWNFHLMGGTAHPPTTAGSFCPLLLATRPFPANNGARAGFWCWDEDSCAERTRIAPYLISLANFPEQWPGPVGIFAQNETTNSIFHNANHIYVLYTQHFI